jgi:sugar transferase (PEP-CTERM/EpsH1 system associated)
MNMRVLFVVPYPPSLIRVRPYHLVKQLTHRNHQVTVATLWTTEQERSDIEALREYAYRVVGIHLPRLRSLWNCVRALTTGTPLQALYCLQPDLLSQITPLLSEVDVVHVEHLRGTPYALHAARSKNEHGRRRIPVIWDSVDSISHLFEQAAHGSRSFKSRLTAQLELERTRRYEGWLVRQFDQVLVTSQADRKALETLATQYTTPGSSEGEDGTIRVLPNGVDLEYFAPSRENREIATLVLSGKMSYHANVTAALHLVNDIMPRVWQQQPEVRVWIVGKDPTAEIRALASPGIAGQAGEVLVTGTVPDIRPYLQRATLAVAPVPYGAGIQNKVLEAMACGTPTIASLQAASGLRARPDHDLVVAEGENAFADTILSLLGNAPRRSRIGLAGRAYVEQYHSWKAATERLEQTYQEANERAILSNH